MGLLVPLTCHFTKNAIFCVIFTSFVLLPLFSLANPTPVIPKLMWNINNTSALIEADHFIEMHYLSLWLWIRTLPVPNDLTALCEVVRKDTIVPVAIKKHMCFFFFLFFPIRPQTGSTRCIWWMVLFFFFFLSLERVSHTVYSCTEEELTLFHREWGGGENQQV